MTASPLRLLKVLGVFVLVFGVVATVATLSPVVRGQVRRSGPLTEFRTTIGGGSQIGVEVRDVDQVDVTREKLTSLAGAIVEDVAAGSPAAKAGLRAGDIIVTFDGEKIRSARHLTRLVEESADGREVSVTVVRGGATRDVKITPEAGDGLSALDPFGGQFEFLAPFMNGLRPAQPGQGRATPFGAMPEADAPPAVLGVTVQELTEQLGDYFGTRVGVLVTSVNDASPAKTAGIKAGDIIVRVNGQVVRFADDLRRRLAEATGEVPIMVMRDKKELALKATLDPPLEKETPGPKRIIK